MDELDMQFHTAVFGGFQKQDVMSYLESSTQENNQKLADLQRKLNEETELRTQAEMARNAVEKHLADLETEKKRLEDSVADQQRQIFQLRQQMEKLTTERDSLRDECSRLSQQVETLKPMAQSYEAIKDRTAGIELEAHGRAQLIENEAREKAQTLRNEMDGWCDHLQGVYTGLREDTEAALDRAGQEMERVGQCLASLSAAYGDHEKILEQLRKNVEQITGPKVPAPIPEEEN